MEQSKVQEIINLAFLPTIGLEQQESAMSSLTDVVNKYDGFVSRQYFYSKELNRWTDIITWTDEEKARVASKEIMNQPCATEVFPLMVEESLIMGYFQQVA